METKGGRERIINKITNTHNLIIGDLGIEFSLMGWLEILHSYLDYNGNIEGSDRALILAIGEDISASLIGYVCHSRGFPIEFLEARRVIVTDSSYNRANPNIACMRENWMSLGLSQKKSYITQGFIGADLQNKTTLLGRGGSDYSAALIAELSEAKEVRIYTDVSGVYTMDPRVVEDAQLIPELSFEEMQHLATFGAKVLHPPMLLPCMRSSIPIFVTSIFEDYKDGTWIYAMDRTSSYESRVKALSVKKNQDLWFVLGASSSVLEEVIHILHTCQVLPGIITSKENTITFTTDSADISPRIYHSLYHMLSEIGDVYTTKECALITMVGSGLASAAMLTQVTEKLQHESDHIFCCSQDHMKLSLVVSGKYAEYIVTQLHRDYVRKKLTIV
ncbi:aspartate kinase domain protein [Chlamydia ibidis 10-1398/6]|nr:aspartate kinase domain protein [Chlamydia ibidis 10-1398/6]